MRGHLTKRGKDSWSIVLDLGRDPPTGKRKQQWVSVKGNKKEAEAKLNEMLHQLDTGTFIKPDKLTVADFLRQWLSIYAATNVRARTLEGYTKVIDTHLIPTLGHITITELRPQHLQDYIATKLANGRKDTRAGGLSARTVLQHYRLLFEALEHAVKWGLVGRNVARAVDPPRAGHKEMHTLDGAGLNALLEAARATPWWPLFVVAAHTGLRRSELMGLRWKDVDLKLATLSVTQVRHQLKSGATVFHAPKTAKGKRQVALTPTAALTLKALRERQEAERALLGVSLAEASLVFCAADGSPYHPDSVTKAFGKLARKLGLGPVRFHDLRHTHASLLLRQGVHPKIVSERLGHATVSITLDTYSHVTPGLQEAAAKRFEESLQVQAAPVRADLAR